MKDCALTAALLLRDTGLLKEIFGNDVGGLDLGDFFTRCAVKKIRYLGKDGCSTRRHGSGFND